MHIYSGISKDELDVKIDELLLSSGYKMKEGKLGNATYVKGNRALRILFGAFVKYFKFNIETNSNNSDELKVEVKKATSEMTGGLIGVSQVKKELKRMAQILQSI
ncbi:MAG: hypothetical protein J7K64_04960 [Bacteroidales bacterium]|nr:hypothetical protein [Bacteroidales bacterium]